jgi:hypothetical protein
MPPNRENLSVAAQIRVDRIYHEAAGIVPANQASPIAVGAIALLEEISGAAKRGNRATVVVQAAKAHRQEGAVVPEVLAAEEEEAVAEVGAQAEVEGAAVAAVAAGAGN